MFSRTTTLLSGAILLSLFAPLQPATAAPRAPAHPALRTSPSSRAISAPAATTKSSACAPRSSRRGRSRCAASTSAARPKAGRCWRSSFPRDGALTPDAAQRAGLPVRAHAGRHPRGRDRRQGRGLPRAARDARRQARPPGALDSVVLVFVPVFNVDGHERFGRWNRPNQRGPEEMGWRTTAQNYNLNRDYVKADAPEMQAMLRAARRVGSDRCTSTCT